MVTNGLMGLTFGLCGAVITWHRPGNPIGWLLIAAGLGAPHVGGVSGVIRYGVLHGWPESPLSLMLSVFNLAWPWAITLLLPLALQLFPDGQAAVAKGWRWPFAAHRRLSASVRARDGWRPRAAGGARAHGRAEFVLPGYDSLDPLWFLAEHGVDRRPGHRASPGWRSATAAATTSCAASNCCGSCSRRSSPSASTSPVGSSATARSCCCSRCRWCRSRSPSRSCATGCSTSGWSSRGRCSTSCSASRSSSRYTGLAAPRRCPARRGRAGARHPPHRARLQPRRVRLQRAVDRPFYGARPDPVLAVAQIRPPAASPPPTTSAAVLPGQASARRCACRSPRSAATGVRWPPRAHRRRSCTPSRSPSAAAGWASWSSACGAASRAVAADRGVHGPARRAAGRGVARHRARRGAAGLPREADRRRPRGGTPPPAPRPARRPRPDADRRRFKADAAHNLLAPARTGPRAPATSCASTSAPRSTTYDGWSTRCDRRRSTSSAWSGRCGSTATRSFRRRVAVQFRRPADALPPLPAAVEVAAYRIATEALTNVTRHAACAHAVLATAL